MNQTVQVSSAKKNGRLEFLDIAKGIGILMVVWAHAKGPCTKYLYQFHMPLFFLISGYLFNSKNTPWQFLKKKIQSLYIPFVFWNILFIIIRPFLHVDAFEGEVLVRKIRNILLTLDKDGYFLGATWFLGALFLVSVLYKFMDYYLPDTIEKGVFLVLLYGITALVGFNITLPYMLSRTCILAFFFALGRVVKDYREQLAVYETKVFFVFAVVMFTVMGHYNGANMGANQYKYPVLFVVGAILASYAVVYVSKALENKTVYLKKIFVFLGQKSISIVIWHFLVFRLVVAMQLYLWNQPLSEIGNYYPNFVTTGGWWIVFSVVGIVFSIIIGEVISVIKRALIGIFKRN